MRSPAQSLAAAPEPALPPWRAIGVEEGKGTESLYLFEVDGELRRMRQGVVASLAGVMSLDPDAHRWRSMFPHPVSLGRVDVAAVAGFLMRECRAAQRRADAKARAELEAASSPDRTSGPSETGQ